jgi:uncharacterized protein YfeS
LELDKLVDYLTTRDDFEGLEIKGDLDARVGEETLTKLIKFIDNNHNLETLTFPKISIDNINYYEDFAHDIEQKLNARNACNENTKLNISLEIDEQDTSQPKTIIVGSQDKPIRLDSHVREELVKSDFSF